MTIELIFENVEHFIFDEKDFDNFYLGDIRKEYRKIHHNDKLHKCEIAREVRFTLKGTANVKKFSGFQNTLPFGRILKYNDICYIRIDDKEYEIAWHGDIDEINLAQTSHIYDGNLVVNISNNKYE